MKEDILNELSNKRCSEIKHSLKEKCKVIKRIKEWQIWVTTHLKVL